MDLRYSSLLAAVCGVALSTSAMAQSIGPSTTTEPYVLPTSPGVLTMSLLTVGDSVNGYRMAGIPDGLGIFYSGTGLEVAMNHEIGRSLGIVRANGSKGAFVSRWTIDGTGKVTSGRDHVTSPNNMFTFQNGSWVPGASAIERLCSADLAAESAFGAAAGRIFLSGEETTPAFSPDHGRLFAHVLTGRDANKTYELPHLGKMAFENALASPYAQQKTVVMLSDDANRETNLTHSTVCRTLNQTNCSEPSSELYMYVGEKRNGANAIETAGLVGGKFYGIRVQKPNGQPLTGENKDFALNDAAPLTTSAPVEMIPFPDISNFTGVTIQDYSFSYKITQFIRIEDGQWDPRPGKQNDYYFVTTGRITADANTWRPSRLWRLRFWDVTKPEWGGTLTMVLQSAFFPGAGSTPDADPSFQMFDNLTIDKLGRIILQEDVGGNNRLGRIYVYGIDSGKLVQVAAHNPKFFGGNASSNPNFVTNDEESSGIVDASSIMGAGWFMLVSQSHKASSDPELVEGGQLLGMYIQPSIGQ